MESAHPDGEAFAWPALIAESDPASGSYLEFLRRASLSAGVYRLRAGARDEQQPHDRDEIYYVVRGRARLDVSGKTFEVEPGRVLFVAAEASHRFIDIEEDLELLVFFAASTD